MLLALGMLVEGLLGLEALPARLAAIHHGFLLLAV